MPYSTIMPAFVLPDARPGYHYYDKHIRPHRLDAELGIAWCDEWKDSGHAIMGSVDYQRPNNSQINACLNRRSDGVRAHNWCYRCPAGYPFVTMHVRDAERESDRSIVIR